MTVCALWKKPFSDPSHLLPFTKLATGDGLFYQSPARHRRAMSLCPADHSHCFFLFPARIYLNILPATANTSDPVSRYFGSSHRQDQTFLSPARSFSHGLPKRPSEL